MTSNALSPAELNDLLVYDPETGEFFWKERAREHFACDNAYRGWNTRHAGRKAGSVSNGYRQIMIFRVAYWGHRLAWALTHGSWPELDIDHINHDRSDNRICNLREVSRGENTRNRTLSDSNAYGIANIRFRPDRGHWSVGIKKGGRTFGRAGFPTKESAIRYRNKLAKSLGFHVNHGQAVVEEFRQ